MSDETDSSDERSRRSDEQDDGVRNRKKRRDSKKIFLCHTRPQKPLARLVYRELQAKGHETFFDEDDLVWGDYLPQEIHQGICTSTHAMVFLSPPFFEKKWPQAELKQILDLWQKGKIKILPILIGMNHEDLEAKSPKLSHIKYLVLDDEGDDVFRAQTIVAALK